MAYQINEFNEGNIKYRHTVSNRIVDDDIIEIRYKDGYGHEHPVWPNLYWASDIVIEDLEHSNVEYDYSVDFNTGEPSYTIGNETLDALPPGTYAIKGSLNWANDSSLSNDVYFHHNTTIGSVSCWRAGSNDDRYRAINPFTGELEHYGYYTADENPNSNLEVNIELGYGIPTQQEDITIGSDYGSVNFQNVTPVVLKRISLSESCAIFDSNNNQISASSVGIGANDSITLTPKTRVTGTGYIGNWETHTNWTVNNTTNWCTITNNQDGSYTFTSNGSTPNTVNIHFTSPNGTILSLYFTYTGMIYRAFIGSDLNSSSMTLSETKSVTVEQTSAVDPQESDWSSYSGEFTITTSDSSVVSVNNTNHTITPVSDGTSTIEVTIGTTVLRSVVVTVSFSNRTIYGKITKDAGSTYEIIGNQSYFSLGNGTDFEYNISTTTGNPICFEFYNSSVNGGQDPINNIAYADVSKPSNTEIGSWNSNGFNIVPTSTTSGNYDITVKVGSTSIGRIYGTFSATLS